MDGESGVVVCPGVPTGVGPREIVAQEDEVGQWRANSAAAPPCARRSKLPFSHTRTPLWTSCGEAGHQKRSIAGISPCPGHGSPQRNHLGESNPASGAFRVLEHARPVREVLLQDEQPELARWVGWVER